MIHSEDPDNNGRIHADDVWADMTGRVSSGKSDLS